MKKFLISLIFVLLISLSASAETISGSETVINPFYEYLNINYSELYNTTIDGVTYTDCGDYDGAVEYLTKQAEQRQATVSLSYSADKSIIKASTNQTMAAVLSELKNIFNEIGNYSEFEKNGARSDYLYYQWYRYNIQYDVIVSSFREKPIICVTYKIVWFTSPEQIAEEDKKVAEILDELDVYDKDEYTQIKAVYDYLMDNAEYVKNYKEKEEEGTNLIYHSSYSALIMGETVCQGYATALYRLLRELGISCRVIAGTSTGGYHAWNIVRIGSYYYLVDATWDDQSVKKDKYFLKPSYSDHYPFDEFETTEFKRYFPMAEAEYTEPLEYIPNAPTNITVVREGNNATISFDLDYTAQYACVEKDGEIIYLEANPLEDKTTHTFTDTVDDSEITYEISALRAEYNSRTETETDHFNTLPYIFQKTITFSVENSEENKITIKINHNDSVKTGKMLVMVIREGIAESLSAYDPSEEIEFTCENSDKDFNIKAMWVESLATMKPLCEDELYQ